MAVGAPGGYAARPTTYKGVAMRSRLEAAFAEVCDREALEWRYEPQCFADETGQYLPDFALGHDVWVECKPETADIEAALERMHVILASRPDASLNVALGVWTNERYQFHFATQCRLDDPCGRCDRKRPATGPVRYDTHGNMACPCCSLAEPCCYTHLGRTVPLGREDVRLDFWCELCGGSFGLMIEQHKGNTRLRYVPCPDDINPMQDIE